MRPRHAPFTTRARAAFWRFGWVAAAIGCGGAARPTLPPPRAAWVATVTTTGTATVRGLAVGADGAVAVSLGHRGALTIGGRTLALGGAAQADGQTGGVDAASVAVLDSTGRARWAITAAAQPGPVVRSGDLVVAAFGAVGELSVGGPALPVRGDPGAVVVGLAAGAGGLRWTRGLGSTDWVVVASAAALAGGDVAVAGQFAGTLRAGDQVVTSAGNGDGFVARLSPDGAVRWLVRVGGEGTDAITGVAPDGDRLAIAGTFSRSADLRGTSLVGVDAESPGPDGFVAMLDAAGAPAWAYPLGGRGADAVAGVAVTASGAVAVAATVRDAAWVSDAGGAVVAGGISDFASRGAADGLIAVWDRSGELRGSSLIGGADFDGLRTIAARGDQFLAGGWFAGALALGGASLTAGGGDDAFVAIVDERGTVVGGVHATGDGREDIAALGASPAGWAVAVAHTAAARLVSVSDGSAIGEPMPASTDPLGGVAIVFGGR